MNIQQTIEQKLMQELQPTHLEVINESFQHNVPPGSESHFKVIAVSEVFNGLSRIQRHRHLFSILEYEKEHFIHALSMHLFTPSEWELREGKVAESPKCRGGSN